MVVYAGLGDFVQKGQVLARYHADEVREARAGYRKSLAELGRVQAAQALAQRNYDRAQTLLSLKAGSVQRGAGASRFVEHTDAGAKRAD
jgi:membrane fusion protein, heavy metal efflux system